MSDIKQTGQETASGRFLLRVPPRLHALLRRAARQAGTSLNDYCIRRLMAPVGGYAALEPAVEAVRRAATLFGDSLVAVAAFGSWARAEAARGSDVDLLIVVERRVELERSLYREWDDSPLAWEGRRVEQHFVHLPPPGAVVGGLWAELAVDGVVLFEQDLVLSQLLVQVRRRIVEGRLVRRTMHGQPYWKEVA